MQKSPVVEGLQSEEGELVVPLAVQRLSDPVQIEIGQHRVELTPFHRRTKAPKYPA